MSSIPHTSPMMERKSGDSWVSRLHICIKAKCKIRRTSVPTAIFSHFRRTRCRTVCVPGTQTVRLLGRVKSRIIAIGTLVRLKSELLYIYIILHYQSSMPTFAAQPHWEAKRERRLCTAGTPKNQVAIIFVCRMMFVWMNTIPPLSQIVILQRDRKEYYNWIISTGVSARTTFMTNIQPILVKWLLTLLSTSPLMNVFRDLPSREQFTSTTNSSINRLKTRITH